MKRVIAHPSFRNIDYRACEKVMADMEQGDVVIRPSSKVTTNITCKGNGVGLSCKCFYIYIYIWVFVRKSVPLAFQNL